MRATPDGYTIKMGHLRTHAASVTLTRTLLTNQMWISRQSASLSMKAVLIVAKKSLPPNDLREFATYLKANVGKTEDGAFRRRLFAQLDPQRATRRTLHRSEKHMLAGVGLYRSAA
jgi:tripartite-type tricarboxylate transporter receptor subunit TctC